MTELLEHRLPAILKPPLKQVPMRRTITTIEVSTDVKEQLEHVAARGARTVDDLLRKLLAHEHDHRALIEEGLADAAAGRVVSHEKVAAWLDSWGSDDEMDPPPCD